MKLVRLARALLLVVAATTAIAGDSAQLPSPALTAEVTARRMTQAVRVYSGLPQAAPADRYLAGFALMELHRPEDAEPLLRAAKDAGFRPWPGWPGTDTLLGRAATARELLPPLRSESDAVKVHAGTPTRWSRPVLAAIPEFEAVGRSIFGKDLPHVRLALFADRKVYDRFFEAVFGMPPVTAWQDGTGSTNIVLYCETDRDGATTRAAGDPETVGSVRHEFGHAWMTSYLMERYGREWASADLRRPWFGEGLADYVASLRERAILARCSEWLREKAPTVKRPTYDEISDYAGFYEKGDPDVHYWISTALFAQIVGDRKTAPATIRAILDATGRTGDVDASVKAVTGKDPRREFDRIAALFW